MSEATMSEATISEKVVRTTCTHDCPDACSALVTVDADGRAVDIRADASHPVTGRHLCVKVDRYLERVYSPDRLRTPLRRTGPKGSGSFEPCTWESALDEIAERWGELITGPGPESILGYSYLGSMGVLSGFGTMEAIFNRLGATQLERSICGPQWFALSGLTQFPWSDPEDLPGAATVVVWGMDPVSTSIHTWEQIRRARRENDARLIVVDPFRSRTARHADLHVRPHPGTDGALALAVGHVVLAEGLQDDEYLASSTTDVDEYRAAVARWTPEVAEAETGVPADQIVELARTYATARPAAIRLGVGLQRSTGSGSALRAIQCLPALTGQWRWPAGGIASSVSLAYTNMANLSRPDLRPAGTREVNMIQLGRVLTEATDPPIGSLYVWNSNPAVIAADQQRVLRGLRRDDLFTVVHDQFLTDTARHADLVLPATTMLEQADLVGSWGFSYLSWNEAAIEPIGESRSNAEVARNLAERLGFDDEIFTLDDHALMSLGMQGSVGEAMGVTPDRIRAEGVVRVGPPVGSLAAEGTTFSFSCAALAEVGLDPVAAYRPPAQLPADEGRYRLRLLTLKRHWSINSSYGGLPVLLGAEPEARAQIHPADADQRGIVDGDPVAVFNDLGRIRMTAQVTDDVVAGTVAVPFGRWRSDPDGGGANSLTSDALGDLANGPTFCDNLVEVEGLTPSG